MSIFTFDRWLETSTTIVTQTINRIMPRIREAFEGSVLLTPDDLDVLDNGLVYENDNTERLKVMWFKVLEREGGQAYLHYRVVRLMQLCLIPLDVRADPGVLARMRSVLRGLYGAQVELVYLVAGVFHPRRLGIVQLYGVVGRGSNLEEAEQHALNSAAALEASLSAAYPQIRLGDVDMEMARWLDDALKNMPHCLLAVGHPDPRENARGGLSEITPYLSSGRHGQEQYTLQQNELVMRGMSQLEEDFLLQVLLSPVSMRSASRMLAGLAEYTSTWAAWQSGHRSFNFGLSIPLLLSGSLVRSIGTGYTQSQGESVSDGVSSSENVSHTEGSAQAHTEGVAHTQGSSIIHTEGISVIESYETSIGKSHSVAEGISQSRAVTDGVMQSHGVSDEVNSFSSISAGINGSLGAPGVASVGANVSGTVGGGTSHGETHTHGTSHSVTETEGVSRVETDGISSGESVGLSIARSQSKSVGSMVSDTRMSSDTETRSQADTTGSSEGKSHVDSFSKGNALARGISQGFADGITIGLAPSASLGEANQWQFDPAIMLTAILRKQQELLDVMAREGGFYTDVYALSSTERGKQALMALIPEAFHGVEDVVMGVQTRTLTDEEDRYIRKHAMAMVPSTREVRFPEAMTAYADSTLLTMLQASAYLSPGLFEEGTTRSVQEKIPSFAFDPDLSEGIQIGFQYSTERGQLTDTLLRLTSKRHFHTALIGDTGSGKSVTAERLAYGSTHAWKYRTIVLDFGQGWRKAINWPEMEGRVDIRQLYPGAVRPLRWNPLQIPKRIDPVRYRTLLVELFANAGRMGPRQLGFMREALTRVYARNGVIIPDEDSGMLDETFKEKRLSLERKEAYYRNLEEWKYVRDAQEEAVINAARQEKGLPAQPTLHTRLDSLAPYERQALMVHRSKSASLGQWVTVLRSLLRKHASDINSRSSLQGVLLRVEPLAEGEMGRMYGPGHNTVAIEDLGLVGSDDDPWGVAVIEGGAEMDEFSKSALLSVIASILYLDAVVRRRESLSGERFPPLQIFFEEANKVLSGVDMGAASDRDVGTANQTAQIFLNMWRDGRKYDIFLHVLAQTVSELPQGILSSCNNGFFGQTKDDRDRAAILAYLARNTKGFVNSDYDRFIARMPMAMAIAKLGYTQEITEMEPYLIRSLMLEVAEPSDREIADHFQTLVAFS